RITVNTGRIEGGTGVNTIPDRARALCDIRIPPGVTVDCVRAELAAAIGPQPDVSWRILECTAPSWTDPEEEIVRAMCENAMEVTGRDVAANLRAGFSDARFYQHAGMPSVVCGVVPNGMGGADEYATVEDLKAVFAVHTLAGFDYLKGGVRVMRAERHATEMPVAHDGNSSQSQGTHHGRSSHLAPKGGTGPRWPSASNSTLPMAKGILRWTPVASPATRDRRETRRSRAGSSCPHGAEGSLGPHKSLSTRLVNP
ncbi:MAG: M20 family metallopeptidase, partial [Chloroflexi bacterium]|nr:M20 family metallopeptidase [Chloroflexota bacterium]